MTRSFAMVVRASRRVARGERLERGVEHLLDARAHRQDRFPELLELALELSIDVTTIHDFCLASAETARDVVFGALLLGAREDDVGAVVLDELTHVEEGRRFATRAACCMLWVTITIV